MHLGMPDIASKLILRETFGLLLPRFKIKNLGSQRTRANILDFMLGATYLHNLRKQGVYLQNDYLELSQQYKTLAQIHKNSH